MSKTAIEVDLAKFEAAIHNLCRVLSEESEILRVNGIPDYARINEQKTRGLRDLNQIFAALAAYDLTEQTPAMAKALYMLEEQLAQNNELLQVHLQATSELSQMIQRINEDSETDGTYDPRLVKQRHLNV